MTTNATTITRMIATIQKYGPNWVKLKFMINLLKGISSFHIIDFTALDDLFDQVGPKAIAQLAIIRHGQHQQIGLLAGFDGANPAGAADRLGGIDGGGGDRLGR